MEAFSSHGNGTLTVIKENSPTDFVVEETVKTKSNGKTCTVDPKNNHVIVITLEPAPPAPGAAPATAPAPEAAPPAQGRGRGRGRGGPQLLDVMFIGR
jgi:hypothetical protein